MVGSQLLKVLLGKFSYDMEYRFISTLSIKTFQVRIFIIVYNKFCHALSSFFSSEELWQKLIKDDFKLP